MSMLSPSDPETDLRRVVIAHARAKRHDYRHIEELHKIHTTSPQAELAIVDRVDSVF